MQRTTSLSCLHCDLNHEIYPAVKKTAPLPNSFAKKDSITEQEVAEIVDMLLNKHFKVYDRLAEI